MTPREEVWLRAWLEACRLGMQASECNRHATKCLRAFDLEFYSDA